MACECTRLYTYKNLLFALSNSADVTYKVLIGHAQARDESALVLKKAVSIKEKCEAIKLCQNRSWLIHSK